VTIHIGTRIGGMYGLVDEPGLPRLEEVLQKFPDLKIFGHSQPFWAEISANPTWAERNGYPKGPVTEGRVAQLMRKYPNLYCDVSAGSGCNALKRDELWCGLNCQMEEADLLGCRINRLHERVCPSKVLRSLMLLSHEGPSSD
jgi:hypothetical protein